MVTPVTIGGVRYESQRAAMKATGLCKSTVHNIAKTGRDTARLDPGRRKGQKPVIHLPSGRVYGSISQAAKCLNITEYMASLKAREGRELKLIE